MKIVNKWNVSIHTTNLFDLSDWRSLCKNVYAKKKSNTVILMHISVVGFCLVYSRWSNCEKQWTRREVYVKPRFWIWWAHFQSSGSKKTHTISKTFRWQRCYCVSICVNKAILSHIKVCMCCCFLLYPTAAFPNVNSKYPTMAMDSPSYNRKTCITKR